MFAFTITPAYKDYLWGGTKLKTQYGKKTNLGIVAESWELSAHPDGPSLIASGPLAGMSFGDFVAQYPQCWGQEAGTTQEFPLLLKLIDAKKSLSIQVHPNDDYARRVEGEPGKTEMWVVLDCLPGSFLYLGFTHPIPKEEMRKRIENNTLTDVLYKMPVEKGTVAFIPAGTVHAIGEGIVLAEVQQSSNSTYRVFDFNRLGPDGKPRPLHIEKALDVSLLGPANLVAPGGGLLEQKNSYTLTRLAKCSYFTADALTLTGSYTGQITQNSFISLLCTSGNAQYQSEGQTLPVQQGESVFIPAQEGTFTLTGQGEFMLTSL